MTLADLSAVAVKIAVACSEVRITPHYSKVEKRIMNDVTVDVSCLGGLRCVSFCHQVPSRHGNVRCHKHTQRRVIERCAAVYPKNIIHDSALFIANRITAHL